MNIKEIIKEVSHSYELGLTYVNLEYEGVPVNIRINKDHARNHKRNDDPDSHNLSLINRMGSGASEVDSFSVVGDEFNDDETKLIQKQVWGVLDKKDVEDEVSSFIQDIQFEN